MKCPKCGYLGFEHVDRCRNCGYEFTLGRTGSSQYPELPIRRDTSTPSPLEDLALVDAAVADRPQPSGGAVPDELPLFARPMPPASSIASIADETPLITNASPPRAPLAVRRATPELPRVRVQRSPTQTLDLGFEDDAARTSDLRYRPRIPRASAAPEEPGTADAGLGERFMAAVFDLLVLSLVDVVVVYFTMKICGITLEELALLPKTPMLAFFLVQNGAYLVAFTAGGQTLGKMATGIKVVADDSESTLDVGRALLRTTVWVALAIPAGLGFLTAVLSRDHRGLHDRFAGARVVRA